MFSTNFKRLRGHRISVWVLVFTLLLSFISATLILPASAKNMSVGIGNAAENIGNGVGEAVSDIGDGVGEAISDVGEGMSEAISDIGSDNDGGDVNDTDGMIGNADSGADKAPESNGEDKGKGGWIALAIAIVVIIAVVVLIVLLIPRRKDNE